MAFYIHAPLYEVKTNFSAFMRALDRGAADYVVVQRYGRNIAYLRAFTVSTAPPDMPQSESDHKMWRRAVFLEDGGRKSRRGG